MEKGEETMPSSGNRVVRAARGVETGCVGTDKSINEERLPGRNLLFLVSKDLF